MTLTCRCIVQGIFVIARNLLMTPAARIEIIGWSFNQSLVRNILCLTLFISLMTEAATLGKMGIRLQKPFINKKTFIYLIRLN
jgi:hypothetical protein